MSAELDVDRAAGEAAERVDYRLTFAAAPEPREFGIGMLDGPEIPDAYAPERPSSSEWMHDVPPTWHEPNATMSQDEALSHYLEIAVCEGVHEVLEWFKVDGKQWLDPHGKYEMIISSLSAEFGAKLAEIARDQVQ